MTAVVVVVPVLAVLLIVWFASQSRREDEPDVDHSGERRRRVNGIEFLLHELRLSEKWAGLPEAEKASIIDGYQRELADLRANPESTTAEAPRSSEAASSATGFTHVAAPPKPRDWSWLAEQQANVFLFAGAFLIVIAALIYVGYSGESLSGTLKVALLGAYTMSFLAAGVLCLRIQTVNTAGQIFLGLSAVLVPLNFVLAGSIISEKQVSREVIWLGGSLTTAVFYTAIGYIGLGRQYAMAAGAAFISAVTAFIVLAGLDAEWWPPPYLALSVAAAAGWSLLPSDFRARVGSTWLWQAHAVVVLVGVAVLIAVTRIDRDDVSTPWFIAVVGVLTLVFYLIEASRGKRGAVTGTAFALTGLFSAAVFGADIGVQYYSLAIIVSGAVIIAVVRWVLPRVPAGRLHEAAATDGIVLSHLTVASGLAFAIATAILGEFEAANWAPTSSWFLVAAFAAVCASYAMHIRIPAPQSQQSNDRAGALGFLVSLAAIAPAIVYGADWSREYYGVALVAVGLALAFGGRAWRPTWLEADIRDFVAVLGVTLAWLPLELLYEDHVRAGAVVHLAAALFYASAAFSVPRDSTIGQFAIGTRDVPLRVNVGWLYAAGLTMAIGYIDVLRALPGETEPDISRLALPLMALALVFLAIQSLLARVRPDLSDHVYVMSLLSAIGSATVTGNTAALSAVLTVFVAAYVCAGVLQSQPLLAAPSVVFGLAVVIAWRDYLDWPLYTVPIAYSSIALVTYAGGYAIKSRLAEWSAALRATGAAFAFASPTVGFGLLAADANTARTRGESFETSALYQWSTLATAFVALLALVESSIARRGWMLVAASAIMLVAALFQIGRFHPDNMQAYTAVIGTYLVLLTLFGISRYRLIPGLEESVAYVEALGAITIMLPSFLQSLDGNWRYEMILLVEAAAFLTSGIALRRRGLLGASLFALMLVGGRVLFDAINAVPNWIVALIIGMALLLAGLAITLSRDRWTRWQEQIISWWGETQNVSARSRRLRS